MDLRRGADRDRVVRQIGVLEANRRANALARAAQLGLPLRAALPNGRVQEIADFTPQGDPVYFTTYNSNAAISTAASLVRVAPYNLSGTGITVGIWDGGSARSTHQEFGSRVVIMDGAANVDHSTHVCGTIAATGVTAAARGMANLATVNSYDWNSDNTEMIGRAASAPGVPANGIYLSNHSYGYTSGWSNTGGTGNPARTWEWNGNGTTAAGYEWDFGMYNTYARDVDSMVFNAPYYLPFQAAGNERADAPATGSAVALSPGSATVVAYDPALHPAGDNSYRSGFDTMSFRALAKNVMTVGSVSDAVSGGVRSVTAASVSSFSSWGPTDDGRIKPDIVANGDAVYSTLSSSDTIYGSMSGTSMACPNATGSAALLVQLYGNLFSGGAMRASTLKGLLIHTADDRGNAGPDYKYGWGLINTKAAADLLIDHQAYSDKKRVNENQLTTTTTTRTVSFVWDGSSPIVATLCWTDPAGFATTTTESRTARLVNNLNLKIVVPGGMEYLPYVMPFVGTWTQASMDLPAVTGVNSTDNVEQVRIAAPPSAGTYQAIVSYSGTLTNSLQNYSLIISGSSAAPPPPPPLSLSAVSPASGLSQGTTTITLTGTGFRADTAVKLAKSGEPDITATSVTLVNETTLTCQVDLTGKAAGLWDVTATNTGGTNPGTATLAGAFTVVGAIWAENFDGAVTGWSSSAQSGSNSWALSTNKFHTAAKSYFCSGPSSKSSTFLTSPTVFIPSGATNIQFKFWHLYNFQSRKDGGFIELSVDNGATWFDPKVANSGVAFASNGPGNTLNSTSNEYTGRYVWTGSTSVFVETILNFTDTARFAGKNFKARWCVCTNSGTSSTGWYVDTVSLVAGGNLTNLPPTLTSGPTSDSTETVTDPDTTVYQVIRGATAYLSVLAADDAGEANLNYLWSVLSGPAGSGFSINNSNAAKNTTIEFAVSGDYAIGVSATDAQGLAVSGSVNLRVVQTASGLTVSPLAATLTVGGGQQFSANVIDQFGNPLSSQPAFAWSASGGGSINSAGLFAATTAGAGFVVTASASGFSNTSAVSVNPAPATVTLGSLAQTYDGNPKPAGVTTDPAGLATSVTYDGSATVPSNAGSYPVVATVTDPNYQGSASGTLVIGKATATVTLGSLAETYDGSPKPASVTTDPAGLAASVTYDGSATVPSNAGSYPVVATVTDPNYQGSASGTLVIGKATATVTLGSLAQTYNGNPKLASVTTDPAGLAASVTYDGSATVPSNAGSYAVVATISDPNYQGSASGTLVIEPAVGWEAWQDEKFIELQITAGLAEDLADPDGDGLVNLAEYSLGTDPNAATPSLEPVVADGWLSLTFTRPAGLPDVIYGAEHSDALGGWDPVTPEVIGTDGNVDTVRVRVPLNTGDPGRHFIRLKFTRQ
ncbi:MAG: S8 family serine peptidase [Verrucomicrobia bacterium]|nr:S8 family serine peptidase [Verrucomicrobiota bacterium]